MNRRNYTQAADLFKQVTDRYPRSRSAPSAMYFRAFSLYQTGNLDRMRESRDVLGALTRNYPNADLADAIMRFADLRKRRSQLAAGGSLPHHLRGNREVPVA